LSKPKKRLKSRIARRHPSVAKEIAPERPRALLFRFSVLLALLLVRPTFPRWLVAVPGARRLRRFEGLCVRYRPIVNLVTRRFSNCDLRMNSLAMRCRFRTCRCTLGFHPISVAFTYSQIYYREDTCVFKKLS